MYVLLAQPATNYQSCNKFLRVLSLLRSTFFFSLSLSLALFSFAHDLLCVRCFKSCCLVFSRILRFIFRDHPRCFHSCVPALRLTRISRDIQNSSFFSLPRPPHIAITLVRSFIAHCVIFVRRFIITGIIVEKSGEGLDF